MLDSIKLRPFRELDTLRFISIFLVVLHHQFLAQNPFLEWLSIYGWVGVDIFFVMSGFLITNLLLSEFNKNGKINLKNFWLKRMIRLWPSWLFTQALTIPMVLYISRNDSLLRSEFYSKFWHYLLHFGNYSHAYFGKIHTLYGQFWTLAVEEHFYLIWPLILILILLKKIPKTVTIIILLLIPYAFRVWHVLNHDPHVYIKLSTHTRFDELIFGCLLALYFEKIPNMKFWSEIILTAVMFLFFYLGLSVFDSSNMSPFLSEFNFSFIGIASVILVIIALRGSNFGIRKILQIEILSKLGILSYGVYLIHMVTNTISFSFISRLSPNMDHNIISIINFSLPFIPAYYMYLYIDKKCEVLKNKLH